MKELAKRCLKKINKTMRCCCCNNTLQTESHIALVQEDNNTTTETACVHRNLSLHATMGLHRNENSIMSRFPHFSPNHAILRI